MILRGATRQDSDLLLAWRNDPLTMQGSLCSNPVAPDEHLSWLRRSLVSATRRLLIAEEDGVPVGTARLDYTPEGCELSWTVAPEARGRGVGKRMVAMAAELAPSVYARIRSDNAPSLAIARACGFVLEREQNGVTWWRKEKGAPL